MMQLIYSDHLTPADQKLARRIYFGMAGGYAALLLVLGGLVAFNMSHREFVADGATENSRTGGLFSAAMAAEMPDRALCAGRDLKLITALNQHGEAQDVPADDLRNAFFALVKARKVCADGRVSDALALYDSITIGGMGKTAHQQSGQE